MSVKITPLSHFKRRAKRLFKKYVTLAENLEELGQTLSENPKQGQSLGAGLYKIRLASESKGTGKSGGFRIITYYIDETQDESTVYLVTIYDKSEESNIDKKELLKLVADELS